MCIVPKNFAIDTWNSRRTIENIRQKMPLATDIFKSLLCFEGGFL